jgi:DNA oxidative demethylase
MQEDLFGLSPDIPAGLIHAPEFLTGDEERALLGEMRALPFAPFEFHGFLGKRRTMSFGWSYRFDGSGLAPAAEMPDWLRPVRARAAAFAGIDDLALQHALLIEYGEGAGLGWHRDRPIFGDVIGISLLNPAPLRFRRRQETGWQRYTLNVQPRSIYVLRDEARSEWEHSITPVELPRYSITFRTLK